MATTYGFLPAPAAPQLYTSVIPQEDLQRGEDIRKKIEDKTNEIIGQRYKEVGTPDQLNKYQLQGRATEAANYLSSLPIADKEQLANSGGVDPWKTARATWTGVAQNAQEDYIKAVNKERQPEPSTAPAPAFPGLPLLHPSKNKVYTFVSSIFTILIII
jgi:hypothetical protein